MNKYDLSIDVQIKPGNDSDSGKFYILYDMEFPNPLFAGDLVRIGSNREGGHLLEGKVSFVVHYLEYGRISDAGHPLKALPMSTSTAFIHGKVHPEDISQLEEFIRDLQKR